MAQENRERLKRTGLLTFVAVCIGLIGLIWADGLVADEPATPGYYRESFEVDERIYLTVTAQAIEFERNLEAGTPAPTAEPHGGGQGEGRGQGQGGSHAETPTPEPGS